MAKFQHHKLLLFMVVTTIIVLCFHHHHHKQYGPYGLVHLVGATVHPLTCKQMPLLVELRQFEGRHTAASISTYLTECCDNLASVGCEVVAIASDNAANMQSSQGYFLLFAHHTHIN